jgi:hypothetical protein
MRRYTSVILCSDLVLTRRYQSQRVGEVDLAKFRGRSWQRIIMWSFSTSVPPFLEPSFLPYSGLPLPHCRRPRWPAMSGREGRMSIVRFFFRVSLFNKPDLMTMLLLYLLLVVSMVGGTKVIGAGVHLRSEVWGQDPVFPPPIARWDDVFRLDLDCHGRCVLVVSPVLLPLGRIWRFPSWRSRPLDLLVFFNKGRVQRP